MGDAKVVTTDPCVMVRVLVSTSATVDGLNYVF